MNERSEKSITEEIRKFVADKLDAGDPVIRDWITTEILERHCAIEGTDTPFFMGCARRFISDVVSRVIGKYDASPVAADRQIVLPGFEYLQRAYTVTRDGKVTLVPIAAITNQELAARAREYEEMSKGCLRHAYEIREFVRARAEQRDGA